MGTPVGNVDEQLHEEISSDACCGVHVRACVVTVGPAVTDQPNHAVPRKSLHQQDEYHKDDDQPAHRQRTEQPAQVTPGELER